MAEAEQINTGQRALSMITQAQTRFMALPPKRRNGLMTGLALLLAVGLGMAWYAGRPDWRILFSGLEPRDVQTVEQELAAAGVSYQATSDGGGVEVPAESLDKARMEVAAKGMPQTGRLGFELFDKPNWVGSEFDERVNYQRALEGELEHTIATLSAVRSARVHLVLPQASLFLAEEKVAKASVVLKLKKGLLGPEEAEQIRNLVAGAVENLQPGQVTLVDADGRADLGSKSGAAHEGDVEHAMETRLIAMLEPLAGAGNVRATVNVSYDQGTEERTDETYDPQQSAVLSTQKSEQSSGSGRVAQGIPGTASNTPAASPAGAAQGSAQAAAPGVPPLLNKSLPVYPQGGGSDQTRREESGTYAVSRHTAHTQQGPGRVRRVTAAVVINDRAVTEGAGKLEHTIWKPRSTEEMHRFEDLAQAAVGFEEKRGDQVVMENVSFSSNTPETKPAAAAQILEEAKSALRSQPGLLKSGLFALVALMIVWLVLKPVASQMVATLKEPLLLATESVHTTQFVATGEQVSSLPESTTPDQLPDRRRTQTARSLDSAGHGIHEQVSQHIKRDPAQSVRLLEAWIGADEDGE